MICDFCDKKAIYKQGRLIVCGECWTYFTSILTPNWEKWTKDKKGAEPPIWVYNSDNKI